MSTSKAASSSTPKHDRKVLNSRLFYAFLSLLLPGLGQAVQKDIKRGISVFFAVATTFFTVLWYDHSAWFILVGALWLWNVWDAYTLPKGSPIVIAVLLWLIMAYGIGWRVTGMDFSALFKNQERAESIISPMLHPDFIAERSEKVIAYVEIQVNCSDSPPSGVRTADGITMTVTPSCARVTEPIIVTATGLWPNSEAVFRWMPPIGSIVNSKVLQTDENGSITYMLNVPPESLSAAPDPTMPLLHQVQFSQTRPLGGLEISKNGKYILQGLYETLALAFLATIVGALLALPLGFLAARNLMGSNPITMAIYFIVRTILNIVRSIEALIMAIIFVVIVGLGPFPGMLAITVHTIAALGKLYSEVIEGIDPGPIEAIRATGATWLQVVRYAVIPQIVPPFTALTIYRWDINVRSSTIIGFVGGGGIGFFLYQWILITDYRAVGASFIAIAVVVIILDFFSAKLREGLK